MAGRAGKLQKAIGEQLVLYVRQTAWLSATPDPPPKKHPKAPDQPPQKPRRETILASGGEVHLPPVEACQNLLDYLFQVGPLMAAGAGAGPVTFGELEAWEHSSGITLAPWQKLLLRRLSDAYLDQSQRATQRDCLAPYTRPGPPTQAERKRRAAAIERNLNAFL
jgi:hypothetical protein